MKILFVDDEPAFLQTIRRVLSRRFEIVTANGPEEGLKILKGPGQFAVVVSDYKMPGMNGITFLQHAVKIAPSTVRILFTGYADLEMSINAINEGMVFRLLTKPCADDVMVRALHDSLNQYRLIVTDSAVQAKKEFLNNLSHEIRTPLNGVLGILQIMQECTNPQEQAEYNALALASSQRLLVLLNDLLDFANVRNNVLRHQDFNIHDHAEGNIPSGL